jgi:tripartite-type tricarboxylate transporter receptor subunit TctC
MTVNAVPTQIYRPFVAPPATSKDSLKILRDAFANVLKDKELLAEAEKAR